MKQIYILSGRKRAGKDTTQQAIVEENGYSAEDFAIIRLAAPLKDSAKRLFGADFDNDDVKEVAQTHSYQAFYKNVCEDTAKCLGLSTLCELEDAHLARIEEVFEPYRNGKVIEISPRHYQQFLGTEVLRYFDDDIFLKIAQRNIENSQAKAFFVTDARFPNEINLFASLSDRYAVEMRYILRYQEEDGTFTSFAPQTDTHVSEKLSSDLETLCLQALNEKQPLNQRLREELEACGVVLDGVEVFCQLNENRPALEIPVQKPKMA